jgi:hypothetical protein
MLEAIQVGKAVAVSRIDELVDALDGAGELFHPHSVSEIAGAIERLWSSQAALVEAEAKIRARLRRMSWQPFADAYRQALAMRGRTLSVSGIRRELRSR